MDNDGDITADVAGQSGMIPTSYLVADKKPKVLPSRGAHIDHQTGKKPQPKDGKPDPRGAY